MQLLYRLIENLPPLAWIAICKYGKVQVFHGNKVECRDDFFVDGTWNGDFTKGDFINAGWFCGTGGRIVEDAVVFSIPTHVVGGLFITPYVGGIVLLIVCICFLQ